MKWSYTGGKINVSSHEEEQQFLLKELIEEADRHRAKKQKIIVFFIFLSVILIIMRSYGANLEGIVISDEIAPYFYIGWYLTPIVISFFASSIIYALVRRSPKKFKNLNKHFKD
tara:strand:- start:251 stop:592 length:342 start_codon:yes stop_codon:yes gene_type:complete